MHELHRPREGLRAAGATILARGEIEVPTLEESILAILGHALPPIRLNFKSSVLTDVGKVSRDRTDLLAASGDFDHDFRCAPTNSAADLLDLRGREAGGL